MNMKIGNSIRINKMVTKICKTFGKNGREQLYDTP